MDDTTSRREARRFALTVGMALVAVAAWQEWRGHPRVAWALGIPAVALLVLGASAPGLVRPVQRGWMAVAHAMSRVTTPIFLAIVYFAVLTPLGLVMRLAGRSSLGRRRDAATYWVDRPPGARRGDLRRQF